MAFTKGKSGNPTGKRNSTLFLDALTTEINRDTDRKRLRNIASKLLNMAEEGDIQAIKEVANRLDGTPTQTMDMNVNSTQQPSDLTDAQLADIATGSGNGTAEAQDGAEGLNSVH